jgi:hypothetical protein
MMNPATRGAVRRAEHELIREALERAVGRSSLRQVSREVKMSPSGLQGLIDGAQPYGKTAEKLRAWYASHLDDGEPVLGSDAAFSLVDTLLREIPGRHRADARERVLRAFAEAFETASVPPPAWARATQA